MIRKAQLEDAEGIAKVHVESWRTTYKGILPKDYLTNLSLESRTEVWKSNLADEANYILVVENKESEIIGFSAAQKDEHKNIGYLTSIYLIEEYQGKGIGKELLKQLFQHFNQMECKKVFVDVLEDNDTRYLYEYYGALLVETKQIKRGHTKLNELIYQ